MLGGEGMIKNAFRLALFLAGAYLIANSLLVAIWTLYFENVADGYYEFYCKNFDQPPDILWWKDCIVVLTQFGILNPFQTMRLRDPLVYFPALDLAIQYYLAILAYPILLLWRKRTVFNMWLVAMAGSLMPTYIYFSFFRGWHKYIPYGLAFMTLCYALAWITAPPDRLL